mgnify:CR=1 FL=1
MPRGRAQARRDLDAAHGHRSALLTLYRKPNTSARKAGEQIHPYLLREMTIDRPNQLWAADITYIPMRRGFVYLVAVLDW